MRACLLGAAVATLLLAASAAPLRAQDVPVTELAQVTQSDEAADRAAIRQLFGRADVQAAARAGRLDLERAQAGLDRLQGERLERAGAQARALDSRLGPAGAAQVISIQATTLIIILLLIIIVVLIAD